MEKIMAVKPTKKPRKPTTSSSKRGKQPQDVGAGLVDEPVVVSSPSTTETNKGVSQMADEYNEEESIIEYSEDVTDAEPPVPLPASEYDGEIASAFVKLSQKGTRYVAVQVRIDPKDYPADYDADAEPDGIMLNGFVGAEDNPKARYRMRKHCETIGVTTPTRSLDTSDWVGQTVRVEVINEPWEGVMQHKLKRFIAA
jgi:hypothetical protein